MPAVNNWRCDEDARVCKIRLEDIAHSELFKIYEKVYEMGDPQTKRDKRTLKGLNEMREEIKKGGHAEELRRSLSEVSEDIEVSELEDGDVRKFYEISVPEGLRSEAEAAVGGVRYQKGNSQRKAFKPEIKLTCHSAGGEWSEERVDRLTPDDIDYESPYPHLPNMRPTLVVVHTVELGKQWKRSINKDLFLDIPEEEIGQLGGGEKNFCPVTVTTYQSLAKPRLRDALKGKVGVVVVDETHHGSASSWNAGIKGLDVEEWKVDQKYDEDRGRLKKVIVPKRYLPPEKRPYKLGLSATPTPFGPEREALLREVIGEKLTSVKDSDIVRAGFILPVKMRRKTVDPQRITREIHDAAQLLRADAKEHVNEIKAYHWNHALEDVRDLHRYKVTKSDIRREENAAFNFAGVMFDAAAMDENKMKGVMERIASSPDDNFIVYSPRVLPLYFVSKAAQSMGIDPPGCRPRLGEEDPSGACLAGGREECEAVGEVTEEGDSLCVWSEGTLPFVGSASRDIEKYRDMYKEIKKSIKEAEAEAEAGALIAFVSDKFDELRDPSVPVEEKRRTLGVFVGDRCAPNVAGGVPFSPDTFEECASRGEECGEDTVKVEKDGGGEEVQLCTREPLLNAELPIFPKRARRSLQIAREKAERLQREMKWREAHYGEAAERYIQGDLEDEGVGLEKDASILRSISEKVGGEAALKKKRAEMITGSFVEEVLLRNLDWITIEKGIPIEDFLSVKNINYDKLIDRGKRRRIPIPRSGKPSAVYPVPFPFGGVIWVLRPQGGAGPVHPQVRGLLASSRFFLASGMRDAVNRGAFDIANFFRGTKVTSGVLSDFDEGKTRILPTTYKEGIDIPGATNLIIASTYTKPKDVIQLTGRIKRIADGKEPGETLFLTSRDTIDERYFRSSMRNLISDVYHTEHGEEMLEELERLGTGEDV
jgi:superfamily II DNA or RNA helicase